MMCDLFRKGYWVWDCHSSNMIVNHNKPKFVDIGGINTSQFNSFLFLKEDFEEGHCPEEVFFIEKEIDYSEAFIVFYLADQLLRFCNLRLNLKYKKVIQKMHENLIKDRFHSFEEILSAI